MSVGSTRRYRYKARVTAAGSADSYRWSRRGKLPRGIKGKATKSGRAYVIEGTPTKTGVFAFTLTATDAAGAKIAKRYKIRVR